MRISDWSSDVCSSDLLILRLQFDTVVHCDPICRSPTLVADKTADGMPDSVRTAPRRGGCVTAEAQNTALDDFGGLLDWQRLNDWIAERPEIPGSRRITGASRLAGGLPNTLVRLEFHNASHREICSHEVE